MLDVTGEQRDGKPPLSSTRIITELFFGGVGGFAGLFLGMLVAHLVIAAVDAVFGTDLEGEQTAVSGILNITVFAVSALGSATGVYIVGASGEQTGSFLATMGGAAVGLGVGIVVALITEAVSDRQGIAEIVLFTAPTICATIAFNLTRKYDPPSAESKTTPINTRDG
jgi:hypothetical protein